MRGYQKKVIYLKNTGSRSFEEAYFVLKDNDSGAPRRSEASMIDEANLIIEENFGKGRRGFFYLKMWYLLSFFVGFCLSFLMFVIFFR